MAEIVERTELGVLRRPPHSPLPYRQQVGLLRSFIDGVQQLIDAGGPVTRIAFGPTWLHPTVMLIATRQGARDVLGRTDEITDRGATPSIIQMRRLMGGNLLDLLHHRWLPRRRALQPMFTKQQVPRYAGHMAAAAEGWLTLGRRDGRPGHRMPGAHAARVGTLGAGPGSRCAGRHRRARIADRTGVGRRPRREAGECAAVACPLLASGAPVPPMLICIGWPPVFFPPYGPTFSGMRRWCVH
jgi:hypothetical protein